MATKTVTLTVEQFQALVIGAKRTAADVYWTSNLRAYGLTQGYVRAVSARAGFVQVVLTEGACVC